jgi:hypothetical protein
MPDLRQALESALFESPDDPATCAAQESAAGRACRPSPAALR